MDLVAWLLGAALVLLVARWALDHARARRMLQALRQGAPVALPARAGGAWGETAQRFAKLLRERDDRLRESQARLEEFLVALENSPNGVVLLDENGRIEWCNQTAASHFGF